MITLAELVKLAKRRRVPYTNKKKDGKYGKTTVSVKVLKSRLTRAGVKYSKPTNRFGAHQELPVLRPRPRPLRDDEWETRTRNGLKHEWVLSKMLEGEEIRNAGEHQKKLFVKSVNDRIGWDPETVKTHHKYIKTPDDGTRWQYGVWKGNLIGNTYAQEEIKQRLLEKMEKRKQIKGKLRAHNFGKKNKFGRFNTNDPDDSPHNTRVKQEWMNDTVRNWAHASDIDDNRESQARLDMFISGSPDEYREFINHSSRVYDRALGYYLSDSRSGVVSDPIRLQRHVHARGDLLMPDNQFDIPSAYAHIAGHEPGPRRADLTPLANQAQQGPRARLFDFGKRKKSMHNWIKIRLGFYGLRFHNNRPPANTPHDLIPTLTRNYETAMNLYDSDIEQLDERIKNDRSAVINELLPFDRRRLLAVEQLEIGDIESAYYYIAGIKTNDLTGYQRDQDDARLLGRDGVAGNIRAMEYTERQRTRGGRHLNRVDTLARQRTAMQPARPQTARDVAQVRRALSGLNTQNRFGDVTVSDDYHYRAESCLGRQQAVLDRRRNAREQTDEGRQSLRHWEIHSLPERQLEARRAANSAENTRRNVRQTAIDVTQERIIRSRA